MTARRVVTTAAGLALALALLVAPRLVGMFSLRLLTEILIAGLLAMSLDLLMGYLGLASFAHSAIAGIGAYATGIALQQFGWHPWLAIPFGILAATAACTLMGAFSIRLRDIYFGIMTLVFGTIFFIVANTWIPVTGGEDGLRITIPVLRVGDLIRVDLRDLVTFYYVVLATVAACFLLCRRIVRSPVGRVFQAIRENEERARLLGYYTNGFKVFGAAVSGLFAGCAGILALMMTGIIAPDTLFALRSGEVVIWAIVGGMGTLIGPMTGAAVMIYLADLAREVTEHYLIIVGALFIIAILAFPQGIVGTLRARLGPEPGRQPEA